MNHRGQGTGSWSVGNTPGRPRPAAVPRAARLLALALLVAGGPVPAGEDENAGESAPSSAAPGAPLEGLDPAVFPVPPKLLPAAHFWRRVFTEIESHQGFLHDSRHLDVVYEVFTPDESASRRERQQQLQDRVSRYRRILERLAAGDREDLTAEQARVLALWPDDVSRATLADAARRIRHQRGQADRFLAGLRRSGRWMAHIETTFAALGLPRELGLLPHVESSFTPTAQSHAAAVGMWQFTRPTGRRFMRIDHVVDERLDPFIASEAAARLLAYNYEDLGTWPLALTAYNHGVGGMQQAVRTLGTQDIGEIAARYHGRSFGFASRNFYASFVAAVHVHRCADRYFGDVTPEPARAYRHVEMPAFIPAATVARALGVAQTTLAALNPALRWPVWDGSKLIPRGYRLRLPEDVVPAQAVTALEDLPQDQRFAFQTPDYSHRVVRGDSLSVIAARYDVSTRALAELNELRPPYLIRVGQELRLPGRRGAPPRPTATVAAAAPDASPAGDAEMAAPNATYRVMAGDSLSVIARRLGVRVGALMEANQLDDAHLIRAGQLLVVPGGRGGPGRGYVPELYTVRRGDSVWKLARRFRVADSQITALNGLGDGGQIYVGQQLRLRAGQEESGGGN